MFKRLQELVKKRVNLTQAANHQVMNCRTLVFSPDSEKVTFPTFSIVGRFRDGNPGFVQHVALLDGDNNLPNEVRVYHMGPPLVSNPADDSFSLEDRILEPQLAVSLNLDEPKITKIARWASRIAAEDGPRDNRRYTIFPATKPSVELAETGQPKYHRFSCAGYVSSALAQVNVVLCDETKLPPAEYALLVGVYDLLPEIMNSPRLRNYMGIDTDPPWRILLPGYLFHGADHFLAGHSPLTPEIEMAHYPRR